MNHDSAVRPGVSAARDADDWVSRKDAGVLMGRSEDTVKRVIRDYGLATHTGQNNTTLVRVSDLVGLGKIGADSAPVAGNAAQTLADLRRTVAELADTREQLAALTGRLDERAASLAQLTAQLSAKDKQLDSLQRSLLNLSQAAATRLGGGA